MKGIVFFVLVVLGITNTFSSFATSSIVSSTQREKIDFLLKTRPKDVSLSEALRAMSDDSLFVNLKPKLEKISSGNFFYPKYYFRTSYLSARIIQNNEWDGNWSWKISLIKMEFNPERFNDQLLFSRATWILLIGAPIYVLVMVFLSYNKKRLLKKKRKEQFIKGL